MHRAVSLTLIPIYPSLLPFQGGSHAFLLGSLMGICVAGREQAFLQENPLPIFGFLPTRTARGYMQGRGAEDQKNKMKKILPLCRPRLRNRQFLWEVNWCFILVVTPIGGEACRYSSLGGNEMIKEMKCSVEPHELWSQSVLIKIPTHLLKPLGLSSLCLSLLIYKIAIVIKRSHRMHVRIKWVDSWKIEQCLLHSESSINISCYYYSYLKPIDSPMDNFGRKSAKNSCLQGPICAWTAQILWLPCWAEDKTTLHPFFWGSY